MPTDHKTTLHQKSKQRAPGEAVPRRTLQETSYRQLREGDFPRGAEEMVLFAQFGKLFDLIGLNSKTEGRHYLLLKLIHL